RDRRCRRRVRPRGRGDRAQQQRAHPGSHDAARVHPRDVLRRAIIMRHAKRETTMTSRGGRTGALTVAVLLGVLGTGCDVTNPGPVNDGAIALNEEAQVGLVNGGKERLSRAVGWLSYNTSLVAREIFPGGQTGSYGHD